MIEPLPFAQCSCAGALDIQIKSFENSITPSWRTEYFHAIYFLVPLFIFYFVYVCALCAYINWIPVALLHTWLTF